MHGGNHVSFLLSISSFVGNDHDERDGKSKTRTWREPCESLFLFFPLLAMRNEMGKGKHRYMAGTCEYSLRFSLYVLSS